jgi:hypothetical protein
MTQESEKKIVGRAEKISFPELAFEDVPTRIDTGAKTSSMWASKTTEQNGVLEVVFFGAGSVFYTGEVVTFDEFDKTVVASSNGHAQSRYKVRILVKIKGKKVRAWFTLADRSSQVYPVLIGRNVLLGKFIVDVKKGHVLKDEEQQRTQALQTKIGKTDEEIV